MFLKQKLVEIRKAIGILQKDTRGQLGAYVDPEVLLAKSTAKMNELNVLLFTEIINSEVIKMPNPTKNNKDQQDFVTKLELEMVFYDADNDDELRLKWFAVGKNMSDPAMSGGSALTYYERYFLLKQFGVATPKDDPDKLIEKAGISKLDQEIIDEINNIQEYYELEKYYKENKNSQKNKTAFDKLILSRKKELEAQDGNS